MAIRLSDIPETTIAEPIRLSDIPEPIPEIPISEPRGAVGGWDNPEDVLLARQTLGAAAYEVAGVLKGISGGYAQPQEILERYQYFRDIPELTKKIAMGGGRFVGAIAPISAISKSVGGGLKLLNIAKYSRPFITNLAQAGITGGIYGLARNREENEGRLQNAKNDAGLFVLFTAGMIGIDKVIRNIRFGKTRLYQSLRQDIINKFKESGKNPQEAEAVTDAFLRQAVKQKGGWNKVTRQTIKESKKFVKNIQKTVPTEPTMKPAEPTITPKIAPIIKPTPTVKAPVVKPTFVSMAKEMVLEDIGQLNVNDIKVLNKAVKAGEIMKGKGGVFPKIKTVYAPIGTDLVKHRQEAVKEGIRLTEMGMEAQRRAMPQLKRARVEKPAEAVKPVLALTERKLKEMPLEQLRSNLTDLTTKYTKTLKNDPAYQKLKKRLEITDTLMGRKKLLKETITHIADNYLKPSKLGVPIGKPYVPLETGVLGKRQQVFKLAKEKALVSEKDKFKPQYRFLLQQMTGKKYTKDLSMEELKIITNAIRALPKPTYKAGKLIPPTIPRTTAIVKQDFFRRRFKQPTPIRLFRSQDYYAEILGVKELTEPLELAKQRFDLEYRAISKAVDQQEKIVDKIGKTTFVEKAKARIKNIPTKAVTEMRNLLNKYEEAPASLSPEKTKTFNWFRNLNRSMLRGENAVREKLGIEPIKYRKAYVRHVAEGMAKEMLMGKYPFPEGLKYWSERIIGKKVFNPMEFQREIADDLENLFTKDLIFATKSMLWTGLKEVHLSEPLKTFSEQLGALSKDLPVYEDLPIAQLQQLREESIIPASTKKWLIDYVNTVIKGQQTQLDTEVNRIVTESGLGGLLNKVLRPFGRTLSQKPITNVFQKAGKAVIHGVMGWRPKQLIRNKFQLTQNLALYTLKANLKGFMPASVDKNLKELIDKSLFLKSYTGIEELPKNLQTKLEQLWLAPYQWTAVSNVGQSMKVAYWDTLDLVTKPRYKNYGWADSKRTYTEEKGFLYTSEKEKLLKEMEFGAGVTQYSYIPMGMPEIFRHKALVPITRLQSWWMNYFTKFTTEAINRGIKGETSYGAKLPMNRRLGYFRYLLLGGALLTSMGYKKAFLLGVAPTYLSPSAQIALGLYTYATAKITPNDWERKRAQKRIYYSWRAFIPGSLAWKDFSDAWTGKKPLSSLLFYIKPEKKKRI